MTDHRPIEIIKGAILMEHKGKAFYDSVAQTTKNVSVREIFKSMAIEENKHIDILMSQYVSLSGTGKLKTLAMLEKPVDFSKNILTQKIKTEISGAGYEAAAISAAVNMEQQAIEFYSSRAKETGDGLEMELYDWLANWEKSHLDILVAIDDELKQSIWFDQKFWPVI
jgi:rubrerythrin